jgi:hypothetical protein
MTVVRLVSCGENQRPSIGLTPIVSGRPGVAQPPMTHSLDEPLPSAPMLNGDSRSAPMRSKT